MAKASGYQEEFRLAIDKRDHLFGMMDKLNQMRMHKRGCDLVVRVGGKEIAVHRNVMMVGSDFFDAMFTHDMQEKQSGVVEMKDISYRIFNKCVEFIYTGDILLAVEECEELLFAAGMLQLTSVCDNIAPFLQSQLNPSSFFTTKRIVDKFSLANLKNVCNDFALRNLDKIVKRKEFDSLDKEYISFLITCKKSTDRVSEDSKMAIVLQWIKADLENRNQYLIDLASLLDFQKISPGLGKYLAMKEEMCFESGKFMKMLFLGGSNYSSVELKSPNVSFECSEEKSLVVFDKTSKVLRSYNPSSKNWTELQAIHQDMDVFFYYTAVVVDNFIYVLCGKKKAFRLKIRINGASWERIPDMRKNHIMPSAAVCGNDIYVVGSNFMEKYQTDDGRWSEINCAGISNCNRCALAVHKDSIYAIGGYDDDYSQLTDVNRYSSLTSSWSSVAPMPSPHQNSAAVVHDDKIYVAGGYCDDVGDGSLSDFLSFDPRSEIWTQLSPMKNVRSCFGLCIVANQLYAVGDEDSFCSIEMYDFEKGNWEVISEEDDSMKIMSSATVAAELGLTDQPIT